MANTLYFHYALIHLPYVHCARGPACRAASILTNVCFPGCIEPRFSGYNKPSAGDLTPCFRGDGWLTGCS